MSAVVDREQEWAVVAQDRLYAEAVAAFDDTDWRHSGANERSTLGTTVELAGRLIGGSLSVRGTVVRYCAFGAAAGDRHDELGRLFARVNPALDAGSFEIDPFLGPVCRTSADLAALVNDDGEIRHADVLRGLVLDLAARATAVFEGFVKVLDAVAGGADADGALAAAGWTGDRPG